MGGSLTCRTCAPGHIRQLLRAGSASLSTAPAQGSDPCAGPGSCLHLEHTSPARHSALRRGSTTGGPTGAQGQLPTLLTRGARECSHKTKCGATRGPQPPGLDNGPLTRSFQPRRRLTCPPLSRA